MNAKNELEPTDDMIEATQTDDLNSGGTYPAESSGWDPYEVWRSRVLQPRLQSIASATEPAELEPGGLTVIAATARS